MANNRMYLFNTRTKQQVYIAKYYPSTGWYFTGDAQQALADAFHKADFGDLTDEQEKANAAHEGFGVPFPAVNSELEGAEWEVRYDWHPDETKRAEF